MSPRRRTFARMLALSLCVHAVLTSGVVAAGRLGSSLNHGDEAPLGAGSPMHEVSVVEDDQPPAAPPPSTEQAAQPESEPVPPTPPAPKEPPPPDPPKPAVKEPEPPPDPTEPATEPLKPPVELTAKPVEQRPISPPPLPPLPAAPGAAAAAANDAPPAERNHGRTRMGSGGDVNSLAAQRGRLPSSVQCDDPVTGTWVSTKYLPEAQDWYVFTLSMEHSGSTIRGTVKSRFWAGSPFESTPPACTGGFGPLHAVVTMSGFGTVVDKHVTFSGTRITNVEKVCPSSRFPMYAVDSFSGTLDTEHQEFRSLGNDGGRMRDVPLLFRRVSCSN